MTVASVCFVIPYDEFFAKRSDNNCVSDTYSSFLCNISSSIVYTVTHRCRNAFLVRYNNSVQMNSCIFFIIDVLKEV